MRHHLLMLLLRGTGWLAILAFVAASARYGMMLHQLDVEEQQSGTASYWCANVVTAPLSQLLRYGAPVAGLGVVALAFDVYRSRGRAWPAWLGGVLTVAVTAALIIFGAQYFRESLSGEPPLSSLIWWMGPLWQVIGV
jgi:hypothetical protein